MNTDRPACSKPKTISEIENVVKGVLESRAYDLGAISNLSLAQEIVAALKTRSCLQ